VVFDRHDTCKRQGRRTGPGACLLLDSSIPREAVPAFERALELATNTAERVHLTARLATARAAEDR